MAQRIYSMRIANTRTVHANTKLALGGLSTMNSDNEILVALVITFFLVVTVALFMA
jgi:hypothetical protein